MMNDFYREGIRIALVFQSLSKDTSSQIGASLLHPERGYITGGYNTFPDRVKRLPERFERPAKYVFTEHAEKNAIFMAARLGLPTEGATLFLVGMGPPTYPCGECARAIIQAGIVRIVGMAYKPLPEHWVESLDNAKIMLDEAGIEFVEYVNEESNV